MEPPGVRKPRLCNQIRVVSRTLAINDATARCNWVNC